MELAQEIFVDEKAEAARYAQRHGFPICEVCDGIILVSQNQLEWFKLTITNNSFFINYEHAFVGTFDEVWEQLV